MVHTMSGTLPLFIVNEFPKSGGTWIARMLAACLEVSFHDNKVPGLRKQVIKGHYLKRGGIRNCVVVWRDGRDVMKSFYYHNYFKFAESTQNHNRVDFMRHNYPFEDYDDLRANLPSFIRQVFENPIYPSFTWTEFVDRWSAYEDFVHVHYEAMRNDPETELARIAHGLVGSTPGSELISSAVKRFDIETIKNQRAKEGLQGSKFFVREGKVGSWQEAFTEEAEEIFRHYAQPQMATLGYV